MKTTLPENVVYLNDIKIGTATSMEWIDPVIIDVKCFSCGKLLEVGEFHTCHLKKDSNLAKNLQTELENNDKRN